MPAKNPTRPKARAAKPKATPKKVGGPPGTAGKAEGDAPVKAYIANLSGWKKDVAKRFDDIISREVPDVKRAVKWSTPFYGIEGKGWFASFGAFTNHVKLVFFKGTALKPVPPSGSSKQMRGLDLKETDTFDEKLVTSWVQQAANIPGWGS